MYSADGEIRFWAFARIVEIAIGLLPPSRRASPVLYGIHCIVLLPVHLSAHSHKLIYCAAISFQIVHATDLGSGTGKPCIAAALLWPFRKVVGVELLPSLHALATEAAARLALGNGESSRTGDGRGGAMGTFDAAAAAQVQSNVVFQCGDLFALDVGDADIVFVASTGFDEATFARLARHLRQSVRIGTVIVSLSLPVPVQACVAASKEAADAEADFKTVLEQRFRFSWGNCSVYFSTFGA